MRKLHSVLMGPQLLLPGTWIPSLTPQPPAGWLEFPKCAFLALWTSDHILGGILCLVTADFFKLVCLKRSHFNQKTKNAIVLGGVGVCPMASGISSPVLVNVGCELIWHDCFLSFSQLLGQLPALAKMFFRRTSLGTLG